MSDVMQIEEIQKQVREAAAALCTDARLSAGDLVVVGCSSSEILGSRIGTDSSPRVGEAVAAALLSVFSPRGIFLAAQCCEHLNRALVVEADALPQCRRERVNVVPQPKAGGSFATAAYHAFRQPIVLPRIEADAGLDIGGTLIGMHLRPVAVPLRLSIRQIGAASLQAARTRPPFIGGVRAVYDESLL